MRGVTLASAETRMTAAVPGTVVESALDAWPSILLALAEQGVLRGRVSTLRVATGPLMSRIAVTSTRGSHLVLDVPGDPSIPAPAMSGPGMDRLSRALRRPVAKADEILAVGATSVAGGQVRSWYHRAPWPPAVLAEVVTRPADGPLPSPTTFAALGALLARLHGAALPVEYRPSPVTRRLRSTADRLTARQRALLVNILDRSDPVVPVHGQPALGHVLVRAGGRAGAGEQSVGRPDEPAGHPEQSAGNPEQSAGYPEKPATPAAVLTGWPAGADCLGGSAALDLGHLLGDMTEIAVLAGLSDPARGDWVRARVIDVRDGYCSAGSPPDSDEAFWNRVADGAVLRLLDHRSTLVGLIGPDTAPVAIADRVSAHLASAAFRTKGFRP